MLRGNCGDSRFGVLKVQLLAHAVRDDTGTTQESNAGRPSVHTDDLDAIPQLVAVQSAGRCQDNAIGLAALHIPERMHDARCILEFENVRGNGADVLL